MTPVFVHHADRENYVAACGFVADRIWGESRNFGRGTAMVVVDGSVAIAVVVFHNYDDRAAVVEVSAASASPRWLTRPILLALFRYAFIELGCQAVVARIAEENTRLARIFRAYGFDAHVIPRLRGRDSAEVLLILTDDAWRANGFHKESDYG